jgi:hypothetical protein
MGTKIAIKKADAKSMRNEVFENSGNVKLDTGRSSVSSQKAETETATATHQRGNGINGLN